MGNHRTNSNTLRTVTIALTLSTLLVGCGQAKKDREKTAALRATQKAIADYSSASEKANGLHGEVIAQFQRANQSKDLEEYRASLRRDVLPAIGKFVSMLKMMPVGTPELKRIHGGLVKAYQQAGKQITEFTDRLQTAQDLKRFTDIRNELQQSVAKYQKELGAYYVQYNRRLHLAEEPAKAPAATPKAAPAPQAAPAPAAATPAQK